MHFASAVVATEVGNAGACPAALSRMSATFMGRMRALVPKLSAENHKGSAGRIGVIGGSAEYTGAPYYAAVSALKTGADLSFVFCQPEAAAPIKSYSPELIVYPYLPHSSATQHTADEAAKRVIDSLSRLHALVVGPGLGRNSMSSTRHAIVSAARESGIPIVLDGDATFMLSENPDLLTATNIRNDEVM